MTPTPEQAALEVLDKMESREYTQKDADEFLLEHADTIRRSLTSQKEREVAEDDIDDVGDVAYAVIDAEMQTEYLERFLVSRKIGKAICDNFKISRPSRKR